MRKQWIAFIVAFVITGVIALSILIVGVSAAVNPNGVPVSNSPSQAALQGITSSSSTDQQIAQLQSQIAQYQTALQNDQVQLNQAAQEMQMVRQLLIYLQERGIIQIDNQGQITVLGGGSGN
jgi:TolA-binding protein